MQLTDAMTADNAVAFNTMMWQQIWDAIEKNDTSTLASALSTPIIGEHARQQYSCNMRMTV